MKRWMLVGTLGVAFSTPPARTFAQAAITPGFVEITLAGVGGNGTVTGESRLPVRPRDAALEHGDLRLRATGTRGVVREITLGVRNASAGQPYPFNAHGGPPAATLTVAFASGATLSAEGDGAVTVDELDATHATGSFEATLPHGRTPVVLHGRFEARFAPAQ